MNRPNHCCYCQHWQIATLSRGRCTRFPMPQPSTSADYGCGEFALNADPYRKEAA